jgi:hypothetical protein
MGAGGTAAAQWVVRLRGWFASRTSHSAQDDIVGDVGSPLDGRAHPSG